MSPRLLASKFLTVYPYKELVRLSIAIRVPLKEALELYAAEFARHYLPVDMVALIPQMLISFIRSDRGFLKRQASAARALLNEADTRLPTVPITPRIDG